MMKYGVHPICVSKCGRIDLVDDGFLSNSLIAASQLVYQNYLCLPGANINMKNNQGRTALYHARREGHENIVRILEAAGDEKRQLQIFLQDNSTS